MRSLQDLIDSKESLVEYMYNDTLSQYHRSRTQLFAEKNLIQNEYTNWRDEHDAFARTCILTNQSHHMPVLNVRGPDAKKLLNYLSPCTFENLSTGRAKQYFAVAPSGKHIGDCILYYHGEKEGFELISGMPILNWVQFHGQSGDYDVELNFDPTTPFNPAGRRAKYRFQLEGPNAQGVLKDATEGGWPGVKFFHTVKIRIAGCDVVALGHGMGGTGGAELSGPYDDLDRVRDALLKAGESHGLRLGGVVTYFSANIIGGWVPYPFPAIYTGDDMRSYREWLPADSWEANNQLAGSYYSENIEDYYWTPSSLGYDRLVKFDHEFIGRDALENPPEGPRQIKRVLRWSREDIVKIFESQFLDGPTYKAIDLPVPMYGWPQADEVRSLSGDLIGMSQACAYNRGERDIVSVCRIDERHAELGNEVQIIWGEINGGSRKAAVDRHVQTTIRATVCEAPYQNRLSRRSL